MEIVYLLLGFSLGALVFYLWLKGKHQTSINQLNTDLIIAKKEAERIEKEAALRLEEERRHGALIKEEIQKQLDAERKLMQEEVKTIASQIMEEGREHLNKANKERLEVLITPLKDRLERFNTLVHNNGKESAEQKTELKAIFEAAVKQIHLGQEMTIKTMREDHDKAVRELKEQTEKIGNDAATLTQALKGNTKVQGDWGEMILEKTLQDCGLIKDQQFYLQQNYKDKEGNNYRPDAIVEFPNNDKVVIDAKVSLSAYYEAINAEDETMREQYLKAHIQSIKKHIAELAQKNYAELVPGSIGYVLMFIPYESGYAAAIKFDPSILQFAYKYHVILLSPGNLYMALKLTHTMWQNYRVNENVQEIVNRANELYDKFISFGESFLKIGAGIQRLQNDYDKAQGQLKEGRGNIIRRLDSLKELGITPKKQIPDELQ